MTPPRTADDVARTEYLLGRDLLDRRVGIVDAITHFETALSRDPNCALAWAGLAEALSRPYPGRRTEAEIQRAADAARRSLTIDPTLAEGHATLGFIELFHRWNWQNAEHQLRQALQYKPESARFHDWLAIALLPRGRITEARAMIDRAHALDPSSADIALDAVLVRYLARDFEGTERAAREVIRDMPAEGAVVRGFLVSSLALRGRYDEALAEMTNEEPTEIRPLFRMAIRYRRGEVAERAHLLAGLADRTQIAQAVSCDEIAQIYAFAGEDGKAIEWLERAYEQRNFGLIFAGLDPMWDSLRGRPQFDSLLHRLGITPPES